jgi:ankyrin repeat protein
MDFQRDYRITNSLRVALALVLIFGSINIAEGQMQDETGDKDEKTLIAAMQGNAEALKLLLGNGANKDAKDSNGTTALMWAIHRRHGEIITILLEHKADVNLVANDGSTALIMAANEELIDTVKSLLDSGARITAKGRNGVTALMQAAEKGATEIVKLLLAAGADVNATDASNKTALMMASWRAETLEALLAAGADINTVDQTALIYACGSNIAPVRVLVKAGAMVNLRDHSGKTARYYARKSEHPDVVQLLDEVGGVE